mmetsp:Transcript_49305/g.106798  ORF Transcript_49305/g.106798 Transcript_49305/m.106798 type:complete len:314 (+) Transcript_49305:702-1643(+)
MNITSSTRTICIGTRITLNTMTTTIAVGNSVGSGIGMSVSLRSSSLRGMITLSSSSGRAESLIWGANEQPLDGRRRVAAQRWGVGDATRPRHDLGHDLDRRIAVKGRVSGQNLKEKDAESPPVDGTPVAAAADHLGRQVVHRATDGARELVGREALAHAHVHQLEVALRVSDEVLGLEVSVGDAQRVQVSERVRDARAVKRGGVLAHAPDAAQQRRQLAAFDELESDKEVERALVESERAHDKGVIRCQQRLALPVDARARAFAHAALADALERVPVSRSFIHDSVDNAVRSTPELHLHAQPSQQCLVVMMLV